MVPWSLQKLGGNSSLCPQVFVEPSYFVSPNIGISTDSLPSNARDIHGLHVRPAKWTWSKREGNLLPK